MTKAISKIMQALQYAKMLIEKYIEENGNIGNTEEVAQEILAKVSTKYFLGSTDYYHLRRQVLAMLELEKKKENKDFENTEFERTKAINIAYDYAKYLFQQDKSDEEIRQELKQILPLNVKLSGNEIDSIINATMEAIEVMRKATSGEDNQEEQQ